jgi:hypothetical protein
VPISRLTLKDQHRAQTNQSETRSLNERKRLAEIKRGKPRENDKRDDFLYALQLGGRVDRVADPVGTLVQVEEPSTASEADRNL